MNKIREIQRLNKRELELGVSPSASWHADQRHNAYINIGGLPFDLTEGDIITIFSQFGEPTFIKLARDKNTGKSRGFAWLKYEDQRSCDLAIDNLGGATVLGRILRVDHADYKKRDDEEDDEEGEAAAKSSISQRARDASPSADEMEEKRQPLPEELELRKLMIEHDDEDPMKEYLVNEKKKEVEKALSHQRRKEERRSHRDRKHRHRREDSRENRHRRDRSHSIDERDQGRPRRRYKSQERDSSQDERKSNSRRHRRYRSPSWSQDDRDVPRRHSRRSPDNARREGSQERRYRRSPSPQDRRHRRRHRSRSRSP